RSARRSARVGARAGSACLSGIRNAPLAVGEEVHAMRLAEHGSRDGYRERGGDSHAKDNHTGSRANKGCERMIVQIGSEFPFPIVFEAQQDCKRRPSCGAMVRRL